MYRMLIRISFVNSQDVRHAMIDIFLLIYLKYICFLTHITVQAYCDPLDPYSLNFHVIQSSLLTAPANFNSTLKQLQIYKLNFDIYIFGNMLKM